MYKDEETLLTELYKYNLEQTALKFGLIDAVTLTLDDAKATKLLNIAEYHSVQPADDAKIKSLLICALLWENKIAEWVGLKAFISRILIRIGLSTSAKMVNWDLETSSFNSFGSYIEELYATLKIVSHEVSCGKGKIILSSFQKRMWDAMDTYSRLGISAPTSAGKSFILINKAIDILTKTSGTIIFIVPTISLINQVSNDLRKKMKELNIYDVSVYQTVNNISLFKGDKIIYVLTQERALNALNNQETGFENIKLLVVDEIQNVEKVSNEDEERAKTLFDTIQEFKNDKKVDKIVISGPRLKNINQVVKKWFGEEGESVSEEIPSVLNISFSFKKIKYNRQGQLLMTQHLPLNITTEITIIDNFLLRDKILGKKEYGDEVHDFLFQLISRDKASGNIIFTGRTKQANETALALAAKFTGNSTNGQLISMKDFIADTVHPDYSLIPAIDKEIAFHHSKVPQHLRNLVEKSFSRHIINTVVSTTTLMQGVNLPAKNIFIRNPAVGQGQNLTGYEFTNLKGRAGRLMKDLVGRAIIIDEQECSDADITITVPEEKNLKLGYSERFIADQENIQNCLLASVPISDDDVLSADIIVYVRNMALKYDKEGINRIREVGINISQGIFDQILASVQKLTVPKIICFGNFYWDPIILNNIYVSIQKETWPDLPRTIFGCANPMHEILKKLQTIAPYYVDKYLNINPNDEFGSRKVQSLCIFAENWGAGVSLKDVINPTTWPITNSQDIDDRINDLHTKVIYGIPKLLRPVFQMYDFINDTKVSALLGFIESGSYDTKVRALIELGVPRETAIAIMNLPLTMDFLDNEGRVNETKLREFILSVQNNLQLNEWHRFLIDDL
ncbi:MAG: DEAD/DEAH box helicase [Bacteroidota bacterium]